MLLKKQQERQREDRERARKKTRIELSKKKGQVDEQKITQEDKARKEADQMLTVREKEMEERMNKET